MAVVQIVLLVFSMGICHAIPDGFVLKVEHNCGSLGAGGTTKGAGASVTIKSDLHVVAKLTCNDGTGLPFTVEMPHIDDASTMTSEKLYYTLDPVAVRGKDCIFFHPHSDSNVYVIKVEAFWGYNNASMMESYETYTLTCTVNGDGVEHLSVKTIDEHKILITDGFVQHLGSGYSGSSNLRLMDILGREVTGTTIPLGKKFYLELSISGGKEDGLTPYDCIAENSDRTKKYKIFNAGCGDGIVFRRNAGFRVKGKTATSPYFKAFKIIEKNGKVPAVQYSCSFTTCDKTCNGSSCTLPVRRKRSLGEDIDIGMVSTRLYKMHHAVNENNPADVQNERELYSDKQNNDYNISAAEMILLAALSVVSLLVSLYNCTRKSHVAWVSSAQRKSDKNMCPCPECPRKMISVKS